MSALVHAALGDTLVDVAPARLITHGDLGRLCAIETDTGLYHGYLGSVMFHASGRVDLSIYRGKVRGNVTIHPDHPVAFHRTERDPAHAVSRADRKPADSGEAGR